MIYILLLTDNACQYWLNDNEGILTSPYYPNDFLADNIGCQWIITAPEDHIIALEFKIFKVSLKNSDTDNHQLIGFFIARYLS